MVDPTPQFEIANDVSIPARVENRSFATQRSLEAMAFVAAPGPVTFSTTAAPFFLLVNPAASGVNLHVFRLAITNTSTSQALLFNSFVDPVVTSNGTTVASECTFLNQAVAKANVFVSPTVTNNGRKLGVFTVTTGAGILIVDLDTLLIIPPGHSLLITAQSSAFSVTAHAQVFWAEV